MIFRAPISILFSLALFALAARAAPAAEARGGTWSFSTETKGGTFPGAVKVAGREIEVDLSAVPGGVRLTRAVLWLRRDPPVNRGGDDAATAPLQVLAVDGVSVDREKQPGEPLRLRPPRFLSLDATEAARTTLARSSEGRPSARFRVESFPGWRPEATRLDVTFAPAGGGAAPAGKIGASTATAKTSGAKVAGSLKAWHLEGQTFLQWKEPEALLDREKATVQELREARKRAEKGPEVLYRIYRSAKPISLETLPDAELLDEVDGFTAWNEEFHGDPKPEDPALRYCIRDGGPPVAPGTGIYVHRPLAAGRAWYAVVLARDGEEDFSAVEAAGAAAGPVEELPGAGHPVLQRVEEPAEFMYVERPRLEYYVSWESPPSSNLPSRPFDYLVAFPPRPRRPAPLCVALHCWGGSLRGGYGWWYGAADGAMLLATNQIPYDWWAAYHESLGTLKPFREGVARSFSPKRIWSFVEWMQRKWAIDSARIYAGGSSMGGAGVSHWIRDGGRIAYGISWVGVHIPAESPQFKGSYENVVGKLEWNLPHESGVPVFEFLDGARFLREDPALETAFLAYSNGKNDSAIGWKQAWKFTRALQETRRPHLFVWSQGGHGVRAYFPTADGGGDNVQGGLDIRSDTSLPAFTRSSLDDDLGDGDPSSGAPAGQINMYLRWETEGIVDENGRYAITVYLISSAPRDEATAEITPRRCRGFEPSPGAKVEWKSTAAEGGREVQKGEAIVDRWGLLTIEGLRVSKERRRVEASVAGGRAGADR